MIKIDMAGESVLITGGTKGIGLETALKFGEAGAQAYLTYKWGADDFSYLYDAFEAVNAPKPVLMQADVSVDEDTDALLEKIKENGDKVDYFISNVGFAQRTVSLDDYKKRSLFKTLEYSTWPMIEYTRKIKKVFGKYPKNVVGISSDGPSHFYEGYDFVAASKALLEHFGRYLSIHLFKEGSKVNIIRFGSVKTESFSYIFGEEFFDYLKEHGISEDMVLDPKECGKAVLGICSDMFSALNGQVITIDKGMTFSDNLMMRYIADKAMKNK